MLNWFKHKILQHQHTRGTHPGKVIAWVGSKPHAVAYCNCQTTHHITPTVATLADGTPAVIYHITDHGLVIIHSVEHEQTATCTEAQASLLIHE